MGLSKRLGVFVGVFAIGATMAFSAHAGAAGSTDANPDSAAAGSLEAAKPAEKKDQKSDQKSDQKTAADDRNWWQKLWDRVFLDLKIGVTADIEILKGLKAALGYRYELEPSYQDGYHWRMDSGHLGIGANLGELLSHENPRATLGLDGGLDFTLVRPFKSESEARSAIPFGYEGKKLFDSKTMKEEILKWLPFTADRAITNFKVGDLFTYKAELNVLVGANTLPLASDRLGNVFTHYIISGSFQVHLVRMPNDRVEMRLVAVRQEKKGGGISSGFGSGHKVFGLRVLDRQILKVANVSEFFRWDFEDRKSTLQLCQYRLDLKSKRVRDAYDGMATKLMKFNETVKIANPLKSIDELTTKLISDITPFDSVYEEEVKLGATSDPVKLKRGARAFTVERSFRGKNDVDDSHFSNFKFAPILFSFKEGKEYYENVMTTTNADGSKEYYRLNTYKRTNSNGWIINYYKKVGWLFGYNEEKGIGTASMLFTSNEKHEYVEKGLRDITFEWQYRDKALTPKDLGQIKTAVRYLLPSNLYKMVDWGPFYDGKTSKNAGFKYRLRIDPAALEGVARYSMVDVYKALLKYMNSIPPVQADPQETNSRPEGQQPQGPAEVYASSLETISSKLAVVFNSGYSEQQRAEAFADLRFNDLFGKIGPGFLFSLLPQSDLEELKKLVYVEITFSADDAKMDPPFKFGTAKDSKVYEAATYIRSVLSGDEFETITQMMKASQRP